MPNSTEFGKTISEPFIDVKVQNEGSIFLFHPLTEAGKDWIKENIDNDAQFFGDALVVEHRYAGDIAHGMQGDGLVVS